jgi:phosphatidylinositol glycan class O
VCVVLQLGSGGAVAVAGVGELGLATALWLFFGRQYFFVTAHANSFERLHVTASFVGFTGDSVESSWGTIRSSLLVFYNTFATQIMLLISVHLLLRDDARAGGAHVARAGGAHVPRGLDGRRGMSRHGFVLLLYALWQGLGALCAAGCAYVHRRHLFVWAIFAPKFCFEAVTLLLSSALIMGMAGWLSLGNINSNSASEADRADGRRRRDD